MACAAKVPRDREVLPDIRHRTSRDTSRISSTSPFSRAMLIFFRTGDRVAKSGYGMRARRVPYDERFPFAAPVHPAGLVCQLATKRV